MIGFETDSSSLSRKEHRDKLLLKVPKTYEKEINLVYQWVSDPSFLSASESNCREDWEYCKHIMENAPLMFLDRRCSEAKPREALCMRYASPKVYTPSCRLCEECLGTVGEKTRYVVLSCPCGRMYCHKKCADKHLLKEPQCYVCKNYHIYDSKNCPLRAMTVGRL